MHPKVWPSILRLAATLAIFFYHFLDLQGYYHYHLDFYAILSFCLLSGYLGGNVRRDRLSWFKKRYLRIMVPYWFVIVPVLLATVYFNYKPVTFLKISAALLGLNMFISDPVYVITWYVTFALLLYLYAVMESSFKKQYVFLPMLAGLLIFAFAIHMVFYFIAFLVGLRASEINIRPDHNYSSLHSGMANVLFSMQKYCYSFFLIHGCVLLFVITRVTHTPVFVFITSITITSLLSVILYSVSERVQVWASRREPERGEEYPIFGKESYAGEESPVRAFGVWTMNRKRGQANSGRAGKENMPPPIKHLEQ
jgi:hypothetical protein